MSITIPPDVQFPLTIPKMTEAVKTLHGLETVRAVQYITRIDRNTPGWLTILVKLLIGIVITFSLLCINLSLLAGSLYFVYGQVVDFVTDTRPGPWVDQRWEATRNISDGAVQASILLLWVIAVILLFRSENFRARLKADEFWPNPGFPPWVIRIPLRMLQVTAWTCMVAFAGFFITLALLPIAYFLVDSWASLTYWLDRLSFFLPTLRELWRWVLVLAALLVLFVYGARKTPRQKLVRLNLLVAGGAGLADILYTGSMNGWSEVEMLVVGGLVLVYPIGLAIPLSNFFISPFLIFRKTLFSLYGTLILRWHVLRAIRYHRKRNREQTGGDSWSTVCQEHLLRFEKYFERMSYRRKFYFGSCPECHDDVSVYTEIECLALKFDKHMDKRVEQTGPTLWINGLRLLDGKSGFAVPPYDAIVVNQVEDHDIEKFILTTQNQVFSPKHKPLSQLPVRISAGSNITANDLHLLQRNTAQVTLDYDAVRTPNPFMGNLRVHEAVQKSSRRFRRATIDTVKLLLVLVVATVLAYLYFRANVIGWTPKGILENVAAWWESIR